MLVDTHAHLVAEQFDADRDAVIERAQAAGVRQIICIGTTVDSSRRSIELAVRHDGIFASVGIHPNNTTEATQGDWKSIIALAKNAVAIGETGLDRYWKDTPFDKQLEWFDRHMRLMHDTQLPIVIHMRDCLDEL